MTQDKRSSNEQYNKTHNQMINTLQEEGTVEAPREWLHVTQDDVLKVLKEHLGMDTFGTDISEDEEMIYVTPTSWIDSNRKVKICKKTGQVMEFTDEDEL